MPPVDCRRGSLGRVMGVAGSFGARVGPIAHHSQRDEIATDCRIDLMSDHWPLLVAQPLDGERLVNSQLRPRAGAVAIGRHDYRAALLDRGAEGDVAEAEAAIDRLAAAPAEDGLVIREIWLLRLRAPLARARGDANAYADFRDRHRDMARTLGFEGHIAWADAMA
jgi:hypothetical protein